MRLKFWEREFPPLPKNPEDINEYPERFQKAIEAAQDIMDRLISEETKVLNAFGIAIPSEEESLRITLKDHAYKPGNLVSIHIEAPKFFIPSHIFEQFKNPDGQHPAIYYFFTGSESEVNQVKALLQAGDLASALQQFGGLWLNRNPYEQHQAINKLEYFWVDYKPISDHIAYSLKKWQQTKPETPLEAVAGYEISDLIAKQRSIKFFAEVTDGIIKVSPLPATFSFYGAQEIIEQLVLPEPKFADELTHLLILPTGPMRPGIIRQFFNALHSVKHPLCFALVARGEEMFLQLSCARSDQAHIERQLRVYFPNFEIAQAEEFSNKQPLPCFAAIPQTAYRSILTLQEFALDPYAHLLTLVGEQAEAPEVCYQVIFAPIQNEAISTIIEYLQTYGGDKGRERIRELEAKFPCWQVVIKIYSTDQTLLTYLQTDYLKHFTKPKQQWRFERLPDTNIADFTIPYWRPMSTDELAALAHFPETET